MKCPLLEIAWQVARPGEEAYKSECLKEKCAWWEKAGEGCSILLIGLRIGTLCDVLDEIQKSMSVTKE
ncbi:hypothetical protein ES703_53439 [subsurface metagenome]